MKKGQISFEGTKPMAFVPKLVGEEDLEALTQQERDLMEAAGTTVRAYVEAAKHLLNDGKLAHLKDWAPSHLSNPGNVLIACCSDGVVVRYETKSEDKPSMIAGAWMAGTLGEVTRGLSQNVIHCHPDENYTSRIKESGIELKMFTTSGETGETTELITARLGFDIVLRRADVPPTPPAKPFCLLSVRNTFEFHILGEMLSIEPERPRQPFLVRSAMRLPVGWECIEVFPSASLLNWKPGYAPIWAENDILAAVVSHQIQETRLSTLDPHVGARRYFSTLFQAYQELLDSKPDREEALQRFLAENPALLCPTHIRFWPKLPLGAHVTDFVFQEATGDYLLVELEKSTHRLFRKDGHATEKLNTASGQVLDWRRYIEDNLPTVQRELGLEGISANPRSLIVIGRSSDVSLADRRKITAIENQAPRLKICTYDDVLKNVKAAVENLLGPLWNVEGNTRIYYLRQE